eukprot:6511886-Karenia_brevis.AAC.1
MTDQQKISRDLTTNQAPDSYPAPNRRKEERPKGPADKPNRGHQEEPKTYSAQGPRHPQEAAKNGRRSPKT